MNTILDCVVVNAQNELKKEGADRRAIQQKLKALIKAHINSSGYCPCCGKKLNKLGFCFGEYVWNCFDCYPNVSIVPVNKEDWKIISRAYELFEYA